MNQHQAEYETFDDDPTLSACCIRDMEDRKQAAAWKAELKRNDPVELAEQMRRMGAGIGSASTGMFGISAHAHTHSSSIPAIFQSGKLMETNECNVSTIVSSGRFVVCLALSESPSHLESSLRSWIDGFDSLLVAHRFRPSSCRDCFLNDDIKLPALVVWNKGERILTLDRTRLEAESESSIIARLTLVKRQSGSNKDDGSDEEEQEEETRSGRNAYFKCDKSGCARTFHHVHVQSKSKNSAFQGLDDSRRDSTSDDED